MINPNKLIAICSIRCPYGEFKPIYSFYANSTLRIVKPNQNVIIFFKIPCLLSSLDVTLITINAD